MKARKAIYVSLTALSGAAFLAAFSYVRLWNTELTVSDELLFVVSPGESSSSIAENLARNGLFRRPTLFRGLLRLTGYDKRMKAGAYRVAPGVRVKDFVSAVSSGRAVPDDVLVRVPEGATVERILEIVGASGAVRDAHPTGRIVMSAKYDDYWFLSGVSYGESLVGYLFPDTYAFAPGSDWTSVVSRMLSNMEEKLLQLGITKSDFLSGEGLTIHEIVTLASIVQKESTSGEMATIAGVFVNRLRRGWRLESDATVNFILGTSKLIPSARDIHVPSPYNTYLNRGLPPGPIGNPGIEAIRAVLDPEEHDYLFFLHTPESKTILSKTFEEHLEARARHWESADPSDTTVR